MTKRLVVTPEVAAKLGHTVEQLSRMNLRQFANLAYEKGYDVRVSQGGLIKGLTITMDDEGRPILHACT